MIRNEELWTQAGKWRIAEQIKEQNLLVMQWGVLRWMCGQDSPGINPKGKCERDSQTLTHLEAHKDIKTVCTNCNMFFLPWQTSYSCAYN